MKIKYDFSVREIAGDFVLVPLGEAALQLSGMITTNEVGAFLIKKLQTETTKEKLLQSVCETFETELETARSDIENFLAQLQELDLLE